MRIAPITHKIAKAWIKQHHRHSPVPVQMIYVVSVLDDEDNIVGVGCAERPKARNNCDGFTLEITRVCTTSNAPKNVCSMLYASLCRAGKALGYTKAITYTLTKEHGTSVKASGFLPVAQTRAHRGWDIERHSGKKGGKPPPTDIGTKVRWEKSL